MRPQCGALIGAASVGGVLGLLLILFLTHQAVKTRMVQLQSVEEESNRLRSEVQTRRTRTSGVEDEDATRGCHSSPDASDRDPIGP